MGMNDLSYTFIVAKEITSFQDLGFPNMVNEWPHISFDNTCAVKGSE